MKPCFDKNVRLLAKLFGGLLLASSMHLSAVAALWIVARRAMAHYRLLR